jgi:ABC-type multidrug transport system fused ATPase/permease subunit
MSLPHNFDTLISSVQTELSIGQRQRLSICRALLRNPPFFIFDEATSSVDKKTDIQIKTTIKNVAQSRTSIVISHNLDASSVLYDKVISFKDGEFKEVKLSDIVDCSINVTKQIRI